MIISQGAEAILHKQENKVLKERIAKHYRLKEIDEKLRSQRTRREARILDKLSQINFPAPKVHKFDDKQMQIIMDFIEGPQVKEVLNHKPEETGREIGRNIGILHANNIIHGDLTTSNMIQNNKIHFIDFGLSFISSKLEDKAVDLHLMNRALESRHHEIFSQCWNAVLKGYKETNPEWQAVLSRLEKVQARGRNKKKMAGLPGFEPGSHPPQG